MKKSEINLILRDIEIALEILSDPGTTVKKLEFKHVTIYRIGGQKTIRIDVEDF